MIKKISDKIRKKIDIGMPGPILPFSMKAFSPHSS